MTGFPTLDGLSRWTSPLDFASESPNLYYEFLPISIVDKQAVPLYYDTIG